MVRMVLFAPLFENDAIGTVIPVVVLVIVMVLAFMVEVFIPLPVSVKFTTIGATTETLVVPLAGETDDTTGCVLSTVKAQLIPVDGLRILGVGNALSWMQLVQPDAPLAKATL